MQLMQIRGPQGGELSSDPKHTDAFTYTADSSNLRRLTLEGTVAPPSILPAERTWQG